MIKEMFERNGFFISKQAEELIQQLDNPKEQAKIILKQMTERKLILCGGDIIRFMLKGKISDTTINSEDLK